MRKAVATKRSDPNYSQVSGYVPKELALRFRIACTAKEKSQSEAVQQKPKNLRNSMQILSSTNF